MSRSWFSVIVPGAVLAFGCSHQAKPPDNQASARVIALPTPKAPPAPPPAPTLAKVSTPAIDRGQDAIFFDFDSALLRDDARPVLQHVADEVRGGGHSVRIEGNCDELGTVEYNLALGEHRAHAAQDYLAHMGVPRDRMVTISYGSQRPKYSGHDESAHAKNRRDDLLVH